MKKININIYHSLMVLVGVLFFYSCSENTLDYPETRLFRPVLNNALSAQNNTITVDMAKLSKAVTYKIELSRDSFVTIVKTIETPDNKVVISDLLWNTKYQVRATAIASTVDFNSKVSDLGSVTTDRFPSIMQIPTINDVIDVAARVRWTVSGAPVTSIKVFAIDDEALKTPLFESAVDASGQLTGSTIVNGLTPATQYQLAIFSGATLRGWEKYTTKDALPSGTNVVDLRGIVPTATTLTDALTNAPAGATVILDGDKTYTMATSYYINKSVTIKSGYSLNNTTGAIIDSSVAGDFGLATTGNIDLIAFDGISFIGTTTKYILNIATSTSTTVGELKFVNCKISSYRDVVRTRIQWTSGGIAKFTMDGCIVYDITSNGMIIVDANTTINPFPNINILNSTFTKVVKLINNRSLKDSNTLVISDCTFSESPTASQVIEYANTTNILQGITVKNTIFGRGGDNVGNYDNSFIKSGNLLATTISASNVYKTNDFIFIAPLAPATTPVPSFTVYPGSITALWVDPLNRNYNFKDSAFPGAKTCGDPRWRQ